MASDVEQEYNTLCLRARSVDIRPDNVSSSPQVRKNLRSQSGIPCSKHKIPNHECKECLHIPICDKLPNGKLPTYLDILAYILYNQSMDSQNKVNISIITSDLILHWIYCNVYTITRKAV